MTENRFVKVPLTDEELELRSLRLAELTTELGDREAKLEEAAAARGAGRAGAGVGGDAGRGGLG